MWKFGKNSHFLCQIWPGWGYATWVDMAGLGSKGIKCSGLGALSAKLEYLPNQVSIFDMQYIKLKEIIHTIL